MPHEPTIPHRAVLTVTQRSDGWAVLCDGEPITTGLYTRAAAETVVETWPQYAPTQTLVALTETERRFAARAVLLMGEFSLALGTERPVDAHKDLARRLWPDVETDATL